MTVQSFSLVVRRGVAAALCLFIAACGGGGGGGSSHESGEKFVGVFRNSSGTPLSGQTVTLLATGDHATTDQSGRAEIEPRSAVSGDVQVEIAGSWGTATTTLAGISASAALVSYEVSVNESARTASVTGLQVTEKTGASGGAAEGCLSCHQPLGDPNCKDKAWKDVHGWFYDCDRTGGIDTSTCTTCHGDLGEPRCGNAKWESVHGSCEGGGSAPKPTCSTCHEQKPALCGNSSWEASHRKYYTCPPQGSKNKNKCSSCHNDDRVWPKCSNGGWKRVHSGSYACDKDKNNGVTNCKACHSSRFDAPLCGVVTWRDSHRFYPCS